MSPLGHHIIGFTLGATGAWVISQRIPELTSETILTPLAFLLGAVLGGRAPDRLEIARWGKWTGQRYSVIPHRTLTHWPPLWFAIGGYGWYLYEQRIVPPDMAPLFPALFALATSGIIHLVMDIMTPTGIPLLNPFGKRVAIPIYTSGSLVEIPIVLGVMGLILATGRLLVD